MNQSIENDINGHKRIIITGFTLKIIVLILMLLDHIQVVVLRPDFVYLRWIARTALPVYTPFMIAWGSKHTKNINRYVLSLGIFALVSEIPFDLAFNDGRISFFSDTNVLYTLFLSAVCIAVYESLKTKKTPWLALPPMLLVIPFNPVLIINPPYDIVMFFINHNMFLEVKWGYVFRIVYSIYIVLLLCLSRLLSEKNNNTGDDCPVLLSRKAVAILPTLPLLYFADILGTDGGTIAVAFILLTYLLNPKNKVARAIMMTAYVAITHIYPYLYFKHNGFDHGWFILPGGMMGGGTQELMFFLFALIGIALVCLYNGKQGRKLKWLFYAFYPAHLAALAAIRYILVNG